MLGAQIIAKMESAKLGGPLGRLLGGLLEHGLLIGRLLWRGLLGSVLGLSLLG